MKIVQLLESNKTNHIYRYAVELEKAIQTYLPEIEISTIISNNLSIDEIDIINEYDFLFVHSLSKNDYQKVIKNVRIKKIIFIHEYSSNEFKLSRNNKQIKKLILNSYKICIYKWNNSVINYVKKILGKRIFDLKIIYNELIYNFTGDDWPEYEDKLGEILFINHINQSIKLCTTYLDLYNNYKDLLEKINLYNLFGVTKNVPNFSVNNLFMNLEEQTKSEITNIFDETEIIDETKLNVFSKIPYNDFIELVKHSILIEDMGDNVSYSILDAVNCGTLIVMNSKFLKKYKISPTQTLDSLDYIMNEKTLINNILIENKIYYYNNRTKVFNVFKRIFNAEDTAKNIIDSIQ